MTQNLRQPTFILCASLLCASFLTASGAQAQSVAPDEAVGPGGTVGQSLQFSPAERSAIRNSAAAQRFHGTTRGLTPVIGAPVPPTLSLSDLPDQAVSDTEGGAVLKYAMMEDDIVVVDPITMRVVDVIRRRVQP
jgi:hypothetical protein